MDKELTLFTRLEYCYKPGVLRQLYNYFQTPDPKYLQSIIFPEELFLEIICKLLGYKVNRKYDTESLSIEDIYGKFP